MSNEYRLWQDNGDYFLARRSPKLVLDDIESELRLGVHAILVTNGALDREHTLAALDHIRCLIDQSLFTQDADL